MNNELIEKLQVEGKELSEKINNLISFTNGEKFREINHAQQSLLKIQLQAMQTYDQCLRERLFWMM